MRLSKSALRSLEPFRTTRLLTDHEIAAIQGLFGNSVDTAKVRMRQGGLLTVTGNIVTINHKVFWPDHVYHHDFTDESLSLRLRAVFFHEIVHVWQFQNRLSPQLKNYTWRSALREHLTVPDPYQYDPTTYKRLTDYGFEQQGAIVEDFMLDKLRGVHNNQLASIVEKDLPVIQDS